MHAVYAMITIVVFVIGMVVGYVLENDQDKWGMPKWQIIIMNQRM